MQVGLKQTPKQWHQKFDDVILSNGFRLNQLDKRIYSKFYESSKGVINEVYLFIFLSFVTHHGHHYSCMVLNEVCLFGFCLAVRTYLYVNLLVFVSFT